MKELLLSEKYRPKTINDTILLPRIKCLFEEKLNKNVIFYGHYGTGKTTLARILIGKYTKNNSYMELNCSMETSIDVLRSKVDTFCSSVDMGFDITNDNYQKDDIKYVFLDEYERMSIQAQDAFKVFVEEYSAKNVRFVLVTNHINKVSPGVLSRFSKINFDPETLEEEKFIKKELFLKVNDIASREGFTIDKDDLANIIKKNFPDFRQTLIAVDDFRHNGVVDKTISDNVQLQNELFKITFNKQADFNEIHHFIMDKFGQNKIDVMINLFGKPFVSYVIDKNIDSNKLFILCKEICNYNKLLDSQTDPIVIGVAFIGEVRNIFNI